jgi:hypothetical protein
MTGGTLCRLGGEVAGVGHFLPLFARLGVNRGRGAFLAELCSLPKVVTLSMQEEFPTHPCGSQSRSAKDAAPQRPKGSSPGGLTKGSLL